MESDNYKQGPATKNLPTKLVTCLIRSELLVATTCSGWTGVLGRVIVKPFRQLLPPTNHLEFVGHLTGLSKIAVFHHSNLYLLEGRIFLWKIKGQLRVKHTNKFC